MTATQARNSVGENLRNERFRIEGSRPTLMPRVEQAAEIEIPPGKDPNRGTVAAPEIFHSET
ncbi:hypothetical protein Dda_1457 [Drechslerella dactyloides]|uniref:Uncharacterized protein n=1 Tax=Drechslerella dactyloides TaxID=74499 RepID=A0AAD6NLZ9_DREDA|nr:hypothetical protein Dda_1457 [Drechslerella dactyloides]